MNINSRYKYLGGKIKKRIYRCVKLCVKDYIVQAHTLRPRHRDNLHGTTCKLNFANWICSQRGGLIFYTNHQLIQFEEDKRFEF